MATRSKMSIFHVRCAGTLWMGWGLPLTKEFKIDMARLEIPVSGWTCLRTESSNVSKCVDEKTRLEDVGGR